MSRLGKIAAIAAVALSLSACALTEDTITVDYIPPTGEAAAIPGAGNVTVAVTAIDERPQYRDRVSVKKNGYGMEMAPIRSTNNPVDLMKSALEQELAAHGFKIGAGGVTVRAQLLRFYNDYKIGMFSGDAVADVSLNLEVKDAAGRVAYSRAIQVQGALNGIQLANGSNAKTALQLALTNALTHLRSDPAFFNAVIGAGKTTGKPTS